MHSNWNQAVKFTKSKKIIRRNYIVKPTFLSLVPQLFVREPTNYHNHIEMNLFVTRAFYPSSEIITFTFKSNLHSVRLCISSRNCGRDIPMGKIYQYKSLQMLQRRLLEVQEH